MRYRLLIEYDGTPYAGWQAQPGLPTIQQKIEDALEKIEGIQTPLFVAGRTDKGVHALGQAAHFDSTRAWDPFRLKEALNAHLRGDTIAILKADIVEDTFHARFSARSKTYEYHIILRRAPLTLDHSRAWHFPFSLDIPKMEESAHYLVGHHDFTSFRASGCQSMSPLKTLEDIHFTHIHERLILTFTARSFLYHQVRNMVGGLVHVGRGKWSPLMLKDVLAQRNRQHGAITAPARGLYLTQIIY